jgi:hypothetical protein
MVMKNIECKITVYRVIDSRDCWYNMAIEEINDLPLGRG